ncbi:MAG TPA: phospholipase D family protein [Burkholderiaceae bacterium]|nr:phospholipase D family protein [Burkholderiaceae bacterium]
MNRITRLHALPGRLARAAAWLMLWLLTACAALPDGVQREPSQALTDVNVTPLAREAALSTPDDKRHLSGLRLLPNGPEAMATRVALARRAQRSLDVQYYLIASDETGRQFLRELRDAARRGVRVRLLIDDLHAAEQDGVLMALAMHDNVEVRYFNPLPVRGSAFETRLLLSLHEFDRVNRRMHNKLFIADNSVAVTGGRNIANEYFMRSTQANFIDMDVLSVGPVVRGLSEVFDRYWNSELSYPIHALVPSLASRDEAHASFDDWVAGASVVEPTAEAIEQVLAEPRALQFAAVQVSADDPVKAAGAAAAPNGTALESTLLTLRSAEREVMIVSPYFIPGKRGLELMQGAIDHGIKVSVMTNSLAATDEPLAYWAYVRYRSAMLKMGVDVSEVSPVTNRKFDMVGDLRSSQGALHAKVAMVDRRWLLIGSMNMDGRSARSNTELGLAIDSAELAEEATALMNEHWFNNHYRLRLAQHDERVEWLAPDGDAAAVYRSEPNVSWVKRLRLGVMSMFIAEELL